MVAIESLKKMDIFAKIDDSQLGKLAAIAERKTYPAGALVYKQEDPASDLCIIEEGNVLLEMNADVGSGRPPVKIEMARLTKGHSMGWSVFSEPQRYTADARSIDNVKTISFNSDKLKKILNQEPVLGYEVLKGALRVMGMLLRNTRELLFDQEVMEKMKNRGETLL